MINWHISWNGGVYWAWPSGIWAGKTGYSLQNPWLIEPTAEGAAWQIVQNMFNPIVSEGSGIPSEAVGSLSAVMGKR